MHKANGMPSAAGRDNPTRPYPNSAGPRLEPLASTLASVVSNTSVAVTDAYVDKGYRGHDYQGDATVHLAGSSHRGMSRTKRKRRRRRSAVEPIIGHMKSDHRMDRCFLTGLIGDEINAILTAAGLNLRKLLRGFVLALIFRLSSPARLAFDANRAPILAPIAA